MCVTANCCTLCNVNWLDDAHTITLNEQMNESLFPIFLKIHNLFKL